ncbi:hypothetical protein VT84_30745 [Gemmata sp. SH-PL17]|uniref:hypothetical protein n=1 Tax=Gemmata sp. SH-PL17 TaxID=1630693 RepID=UPI00078E2A51|nr:hypothetical protein [Gemmata sp. SH-PL17]AMV28812.1 hypothetical protein VT84_30745 [Gemmata sp. SH-PL17]
MNLKSLERRLAKLATNEAEAAVAARFAAYAKRPVAYVEKHLKSYVTPKQREILELLDKPPYRVLARSANTQGKTFIAASKCCHFFDTERPSITLATAPTAKSVTDLLFKEIRRLRPGDRQLAPKAPRLQASHEHYVDGYTSNNPDAFQGRHGARLGLVFDEATGIDPAFWARAETMFESHGGHWWLATYNPNDSASPAYLAEESRGWHVVVLSALEHPNVLAELNGDTPPVPAAVRLSTVLRRMAAECEETRNPDPAVDFEFPIGSGVWWHPKTPDFEAQIMGRWPVSPTSALFSPFLVESCFRMQRAVDPRWQFAMGCDVARFGDDKTTIALRCGPCLLRLESHSGVNTTWIADRLRTVIRETFGKLGLVPDDSMSVPIFIDDTGGYGAGVIDQAHGYNFIGVNNSEKSPDPRYPNTRSFVWCELAALAQAGALDLSRLPLNERQNIKAELTAARYRIDSAGRRVVEPKAQIKERLKRSPDRADALTLCYYLAAQSVPRL